MNNTKFIVFMSAILLFAAAAAHFGNFATASKTEEELLQTYPEPVMEQVRKSLGGSKHNRAYDEEIMNLPKAEVMDYYFDAHGRTKGFGPEMREVVLAIYGINLDAISAMENSGVTIFSKGTYITKQPHDLFELRSNHDDSDVTISITDYYKEVTGSAVFPKELGVKLEELAGSEFRLLDSGEAYYFDNKVPIPDEDKHPIMGTLLRYIETNYSKHLNN
ncbi:hypothetical protein [Alteribacter natronophilus]|uniref:hypothetical protein n=1 Tax=Alteribacter natronophilus TaxID=2583810 RepID=UPI00110D6CCB|nr:hypothetical protein [Alteribacter natronophilus]TMW73077.1 hypothetical protein FGB90_01850 [Alteribacter natronophilus]